MGTLSPPFILCPLSDRKELHGMSEDRLQNKVIITIGRNIAIRYHILEQKQETSWTISRHWLTSRVVFCSEVEKYGAVIDHTTVALWDEDDTALSKFKKHKFSQPVFELRPTKTSGTLVIFENGYVTTLNQAIEKRNIAESKGFVDTETDIILDVDINERDNQVILIVASKVGDKKLHRHIQKRKSLQVFVTKLQAGTEDEVTEERSQIEISQEGVDIIGHCIVCDDGCSLVYLCSDGKLYRQMLNTGKSVTENKSVVGVLKKYVSTKTPVVIRYIEDGDCFAIYGSDASEEGAIVFLYDLKYDIVVAKQSLKMYGTPPIMNKIGTSVIVPVGLHILVLGFRASKSLLSAVVGKHQIRSGEEVFEERNPWDIPTSDWTVDKDVPVLPYTAIKKQKEKLEKHAKREIEMVKKKFPQCWEVVRQFKILEREGQPESLICNQIIPMALEKKNFVALDWIMDSITDIPESYLIAILSFLLNQLKEPIVIKKKLCHVTQTPTKSLKDEDAPQIESAVYFPDSRINQLLLRNFDDQQLVKSLPSLDYEKARKFVLYLKSMMDQFWASKDQIIGGEENSVGVEGDAACWMKWISAVLDAHYPKFVFNNEISLIEEMLIVLEEKAMVMNAIEELEPYLVLTYNKVKFEARPNPNSKWRSEIVTFV